MITIKEIARISGFSTTTISNVIHGKTEKVSQENIDKIQKLLKELNYIPRMGLSSLSNKKSQIISVVIHIQQQYEDSILSDPFYGKIVGCLEKVIRDAGYFMMLYTSENLEDIFKMAVSWNVDGIIAISFTYENYQKIRTMTNKPIVAIDMYKKHKDDYVNIGLDDEDGGYQMTKYLIESGYQNILIIANMDFGVDHQRYKGYIRAFKEFNIPLKDKHFIELDSSPKKKERKLKSLLNYANKDYAMFFLSDKLASEAIHFFIKNGVSIPEDISIAGFDDNLYAKLLIPQLTSVHQDVGLKAKTAVEVLIELINNVTLEQSNIVLPVNLSIKDSVKKRTVSN